MALNKLHDLKRFFFGFVSDLNMFLTGGVRLIHNSLQECHQISIS